jgi:hypothetical protein
MGKPPYGNIVIMVKEGTKIKGKMGSSATPEKAQKNR